MHDPLKPYQNLPALPPKETFTTPEIMQALIQAHSQLAAVKHASRLLSNPEIIINAVPLLESQASSAIENIVTTQDELFKATALPPQYLSPQIKETLRYRTGLKAGFDELDLLPFDALSEKIVTALRGEETTYRKKPGTKIMNAYTREVFYTPPTGEKTITKHMTKWADFVASTELDPVVATALAHYQFEAIHPYHDGNGRTGRILMQLQLIKYELVDQPILYISRYINLNKNEYYEVLRKVTRENAWHEWCLYIIQAIEHTAQWTLQLINDIEELNRTTVKEFKEKLPKLYSYELVQYLFMFPYCRIEQLAEHLGITRQTASTWLSAITKAGFLEETSVGRNKIYINRALVQLFA